MDQWTIMTLLNVDKKYVKSVWLLRWNKRPRKKYISCVSHVTGKILWPWTTAISIKIIVPQSEQTCTRKTTRKKKLWNVNAHTKKNGKWSWGHDYIFFCVHRDKIAPCRVFIDAVPMERAATCFFHVNEKRLFFVWDEDNGELHGWSWNPCSVLSLCPWMKWFRTGYLYWFIASWIKKSAGPLFLPRLSKFSLIFLFNMSCPHVPFHDGHYDHYIIFSLY